MSLELAVQAVRIYAESHPRPSSVTQKQAGEMLGLSHVTVSRMVRDGRIKLNKIGQIPISEIDRLLAAN